MRKLIAAINMTLDGYCDHTAVDADEELHLHYADLLKKAGAILYGRTTYQLMEFWKTAAEKPTGDKAMDEFALIMDKTPKIVFSRTLKNANWKSARIANRQLEEEVLELRREPGKDLFVCSRSLIIQLMKLNFIDEYQLCVHPVVAGGGLPLFENVTDKTLLKLTGTKVFNSGAITLYYEPSGHSTTSR